jgi:hypothetical protein
MSKTRGEEPLVGVTVVHPYLFCRRTAREDETAANDRIALGADAERALRLLADAGQIHRVISGPTEGE